MTGLDTYPFMGPPMHLLTEEMSMPDAVEKARFTARLIVRITDTEARVYRLEQHWLKGEQPDEAIHSLPGALRGDVALSIPEGGL